MGDVLTFNQGGIVIDGVSYTVPAIRQIILERHQLADDLQRAKMELMWTFPGPEQDGTLKRAIDLHQKGLKQLAEKNGRLREQLRRNDVHLQRRTAALVRLIAHGSTMTTCSCPTSPGSAASRCSTGCCAGRAGLETWPRWSCR